ncbi:MAG: DUF1292 domain-containing protein [Eubacteriales bacterium]|nr:DUF1292 domain-containing protein [Eubacteriales bacterium]
MNDQTPPETPGEQDEHMVTLQDENGNDVNFDHLMTVEFQGANYILLEAQQDMEDCLQGESIILKIEQDESGDDVYATIEDENEYSQVFQKCLQLLEKEDEEEGGE